MENKTNLIIAVRGYKNVKKEKTANSINFTAFDEKNRKILLKIIEPLGNEYIGIGDIKHVAESIQGEGYDKTVIISKQFTDNAIDAMDKHKIQYISDDYMPPFKIEELYLAIVNCANNQCQKKCGKILKVISECSEKKIADTCKIKMLAGNAKSHFEQGSIGLLKNDLKLALALNR